MATDHPTSISRPRIQASRRRLAAVEVTEGIGTRSAGQSRLSVASLSPICAYASRVLARNDTNNRKRSGRFRRQHEQLSQGLPRSQRLFVTIRTAEPIHELHERQPRTFQLSFVIWVQSKRETCVPRAGQTTWTADGTASAQRGMLSRCTRQTPYEVAPVTHRSRKSPPCRCRPRLLGLGRKATGQSFETTAKQRGITVPRIRRECGHGCPATLIHGAFHGGEGNCCPCIWCSADVVENLSWWKVFLSSTFCAAML